MKQTNMKIVICNQHHDKTKNILCAKLAAIKTYNNKSQNLMLLVTTAGYIAFSAN